MIAQQAEKILRDDPDVFGTFAIPGFSLSGGSSPNYGVIFAPLKPIDERKGKGHAASDIVARVSPKLFGVPGGIVVAFEPPAINGLGNFGGFQFQLQDLGRNTLQDLDNVAHKIVSASRQRSDLQGLFTSYTANDPQQLVQIDREKAKAMGVPISQVSQALGVYMGSQYINDFDFNNRSYRVYVQADQPFRMNSRDLRQYYVRSDTSGLVPLGQPCLSARDLRAAGDQSLQPVSLGGNRRRGRARIQLRPGADGHGGPGETEHAARHVL